MEGRGGVCVVGEAGFFSESVSTGTREAMLWKLQHFGLSFQEGNVIGGQKWIEVENLQTEQLGDCIR